MLDVIKKQYSSKESYDGYGGSRKGLYDNMLFLVRGSSGSGKSTIASVLKRSYVNPFVLHLETDAQFVESLA
jgi:adenylylsulfate kinase-like enzyme